MPDADRLLLFADVVRAGSFAAAGRELGITRQSVSEHIARLEEELGVRLLERTTRSLRTTEAGSVLYERARHIKNLVSEATAEVTGMQSEPVGLLRVTVPGAFGRVHAPVIAADLLARHAQLSLEVHIADRFVHLVDEGFDAAVRIGDLEDSTLLRRKVGEERLVFVASPRLLNTHREPEPGDLAALPAVGLTRRETWTVHGTAHVIEPRLVLDALQAVCAAAIAGAGIARLPSFAVAEAVHRGELRVIFPDDPGAVRELWVVYPSRRFLAPKVRCFIEAVSQHVHGVFGMPLGVPRAQSAEVQPRR